MPSNELWYAFSGAEAGPLLTLPLLMINSEPHEGHFRINVLDESNFITLRLSGLLGQQRSKTVNSVSLSRKTTMPETPPYTKIEFPTACKSIY